MVDVELRDVDKVFDPLVGPIVCQLRCATDFVSPSPIPHRSVFVFFRCFFMHLWLYDGLVAMDYDQISFLLN